MPELTVAGIHAQHADFVWRSLQRLGVRPMALDDALQEVFIVVHKRLASFDGSSQLTTWLFGICLRVAAAQRRQAHLRQEEASETLETTESPDLQPEEAAMEREARVMLGRVLDRLDLEKRAVFVMFELDDLSAPAIASMIGIPVSTVYSRLAAARTEFKLALERLKQRDAFRGKHV
jgi:RNA polymerase sigma-70 factor (ECF subfamily)